MTFSKKQRDIDGLLPESELFELIMTTMNRDDTTNASPVGVTRTSNLLEANLSESSHTLRNMKNNGIGILNLVNDPLIFAQTAFDHYDQEIFVPVGNMFRCRDATGIIEVELESSEVFVKRDRLGPSKFVRTVLSINKIKVLKPSVPYSRRRAAAIEAVIAVTRAEVAYERGLLDIFGELKDRVNELKELTGGPDGPSKATFELCEERLNSIVGLDRDW
jgi:hypothetical protein